MGERIANIKVGSTSSMAKNLLSQLGNVINPATEESVSNTDNNVYWLKQVVRLLKPLNIVTGAGSNCLSVDVNSVTGTIAAVTTVTTVTTTTTVGTVSNQTNIGNVSAFTLQQSLTRNAFANGIRGNLTF